MKVAAKIAIAVIILSLTGCSNTAYKTEEIEYIRSDLQKINTVLDELVASKHEILKQIEINRLAPYISIVAAARKNVSDGYTTEDIVFALDKAYAKYKLSSLNFTLDDWFAQARVESVFNSQVTSRVGAMGLLQVMPSTATWLNRIHFKIDNFSTDMLYDPYICAEFGAYYMKTLLVEYRDKNVALEAYNGGPGNIGIAATRGYRNTVLTISRSYLQKRGN